MPSPAAAIMPGSTPTHSSNCGCGCNGMKRHGWLEIIVMIGLVAAALAALKGQ
jgi:hypothetical protein